MPRLVKPVVAIRQKYTQEGPPKPGQRAVIFRAPLPYFADQRTLATSAGGRVGVHGYLIPRSVPAPFPGLASSARQFSIECDWLQIRQPQDPSHADLSSRTRDENLRRHCLDNIHPIYVCPAPMQASPSPTCLSLSFSFRRNFCWAFVAPWKVGKRRCGDPGCRPTHALFLGYRTRRHKRLVPPPPPPLPASRFLPRNPV